MVSVALLSLLFVYLNVTFTFTKVATSSTIRTKTAYTYVDPAYLTLINNIQANLNRMYTNDASNPFFIDNPNAVSASDVESVIRMPFNRSGMASTLYWNVFFPRAAWLDSHCINRFANCGPTKVCSCLLQTNVIDQLLWDRYHMFTAQDLYTYKTLNIAGCTGAARVFMDIAKSYPLFTAMYYVTTVEYEDYQYACPQQDVSWRDYTNKMDGHQVVAIQMPSGRWRILNTSSGTLSWALRSDTNDIFEASSVSAMVSNRSTRVDIRFPGIPNDGSPLSYYTITGVGVDDVTTHNRLMNKYSSGNTKIPYCQWPL